MVSAIHILSTGLGAAFLLGLLPEAWRGRAHLVTLAALALMSAIALSWVLAFAFDGQQMVDVFTAGVSPPFAINLRLGMAEAALSLTVCLSGLLSALYLKTSLITQGRRAMAVLLIAVMAFCGIILTRDIFNLFVFVELSVVSVGGLVLLSDDNRALGAGFKYLIVSQVVSILMLLGVIFLYHAGGTLNIDTLTAANAAGIGTGGLAFFLLLMAVVAEAKPVPANGWALDIYQAAHPAFSALFSAAAGTAALFAVDKVLVMGGPTWPPVVAGIGLFSFVAANVLGLSQTHDRRLLGYSSIAQIGLVLGVVGLKDVVGEHYLFIAGGILVAHAVAKAGMFWLSGLVAERKLSAWAVLRKNPILLFAFATFVALLVGLPPFPGFYAKWELIHALMAQDRVVLVALILLGALLEATYLMRWFGYALKRGADLESVQFEVRKVAVVLTAALGGWGLGYVWGELSGHANLLHSMALLFALGFVVLDGLPAWVKNTVAIAGMSAFFYVSYPGYDPLQLIFASIILLGGAAIFVAGYHERGRRLGFYPSAMLMYAGLAMLIVADTTFQFFAAWEVLTVGSYFLILRGKESEPHALSYIVFSLGGAFALMAGFALASGGVSEFAIQGLSDVAAEAAPWVFVLLAVGFMTKTAAIGLHIWLPGAHAEAETDVSPMVSGILLKAGLFGLFTLLMTMGKTQMYGVELTHVLMWIGAISALLGNLMAVFQEDAKRLLAYSSIGQMGYALFGLAMMNHLGWLMALMFVINHYVYKSMLFLSVGGVAKRTGTKLMYRMGGLITLMPLSFVAVLIGIIAMSGVPPLSGFGGRWIFYNAIMTAEYKLPILIIFLSGPIAFLYLFRLIHTIFLGQLKDEHRRITEAPFWIVVPQMLFVAFLLGFAVVPGLALRHVDAYIAQFFVGGGLSWDGLTITSPFGYWSPVSIMIVTGAIFAVLLAWLVFLNHKAQKVKQFNIVFAAERPHRPETTHFAWNFYAPYRKAFGFLLKPYATWFWDGVAGAFHGVAETARRFYTGDGQVYAFHMLGFVLVVYLIAMGM
ncbi:MAG: NADH-quinone oxidoreductase subunit F [Alphaproteobacteria bacterium]|nr:NADH-quinone oxidoreductase subunit F [Alphaproteobacteria bacterium]